MTALPGKVVADMDVTLNDVPAHQHAVFSDTLCDWLGQLRSIPPPPGGAVCGFLGTPVRSYRCEPLSGDTIGPFESQNAFHSGHWGTLTPTADSEIRALAKRVRETPYRICFTHGDLNPQNILVDADFKPVGLIDWECAGWMPECWELVSATWRSQIIYHGWYAAFKRALPPYEDEEIIDKELRRTVSLFLINFTIRTHERRFCRVREQMK